LNILIVKTKKSEVITVLFYIVIILSIIVGSLFLYYDTKFEKPKRAETNKKKVMSNISIEINKIKNLLPANQIIELKFENNYIYLKLKPKTNIEPLITRYEDMLKIKYDKNFTLIKIKKKEIKTKKIEKDDVYDYLLNKDVILKKIEKDSKNTKEMKEIINQ